MPEFLFDGEKKVLKLDARKKVYDVVRKCAGCHFRELERKSGLSTGSVKHHLDYLARFGLIILEKEGSNLRYFPREFKSDNKILMGLLRQESVRKILLFILTHDRCTHEQIVKAVRLSPSTVSWHLKKLTDHNIIGFIRKGRKTHYNILVDKDEIVKLLITYRQSFVDSLVDRVIEAWDI